MKNSPRKRKSATQIAFTVITVLLLLSMVLSIVASAFVQPF